MEFLTEYSTLIVGAILLFLQFVSNLVYLVTNKSKISKQKSILEVLQSMKYRLPDYLEHVESKGQTFDEVVPEYGLDEKSNVLVKTGERNLVEEVQQYKDCALQAMLDKFGYDTVLQAVNAARPNVVGESDEPIVDDLIDDIDEFNAFSDYLDDVRQRYKLREDMSVDDVLKYLNEQKSKVSDFLKKNSEVKENDKKVDLSAEKKE